MEKEMKKKIEGIKGRIFIAALCAAMISFSACASGTGTKATTSNNGSTSTASVKDAGSDNSASASDSSKTDLADAADTNSEKANTDKDGSKDIQKTVNQLRDVQTGDIVADMEITGMGKVTILLFPDQAPKAVENFVQLSKQGYYDGVTFHRVIEDFMLQGGDPTGTGRGGESVFGGAFEDEISADLFPVNGSLCMANSGKNTNGSQFFIVTCKDVVSYSQLEQVAQSYKTNYGIDIDYSKMSKQCRNNYASVGGAYWLYCQHTVFGQVVEGMDIIEAADSVETDSNDKPVNDLVIEKITIRTV